MTMAANPNQNQNGVSSDSKTSTNGAGNKNDNASNLPPTAGLQVADLVNLLEDYTTVFPDSVICNFVNISGFSTSDARIVRLISLAAQKFLSDVAIDALQHCKVRTSNQPSNKSKTKDRSFTLTMEDLIPALAEHGIVAKKPPYYI